MANLIIVKNDYTNPDALKRVVRYVLNESKTNHITGGQGVLLDTPYSCMEKVKEYYYKTNGKLAQHFILSFADYEYISIDEALCIGYEVCALFPGYQMVFGFHTNTAHRHIHWGMNPVNVLTGKKFNFGYAESSELETKINSILKPYNTSCELKLNQNEI